MRSFRAVRRFSIDECRGAGLVVIHSLLSTVLLFFGVGFLLGQASIAQQTSEGAGEPIAWVRAADSDTESYEGTSYHSLGLGYVELTFDVQPDSQHAIDLLWGARKDQRGAQIYVNGRGQSLTAGGYDGFRWQRIDVSGDVTGDTYTIRLETAGPNAAFLAAARLVDGSTPVNPRDTALPRAMRSRASWCLIPPDAPYAGVHHKSFDDPFRDAAWRGRQANQALRQSQAFVDGWLDHADPESGLIPRNLGESSHFWNGKDTAADNWPFMVLTTSLTDRSTYEGRMHQILRTETELTSRRGALVDPYSFRTDGFLHKEADLDRMLFQSSEYVKDGLMPITEWLGPSPFSERMIDIVDSILEHSSHETEFGTIPSTDIEVNGEMMQVLSRLRFMTGERRYLDRAVQIADYYLLGDHHPTRTLDTLRLRDHGNELISGLTEVYAAVHAVREDKVEPYREPLHAMLDRILEVGRNEHGMMFNEINPQTGDRLQPGLVDTYGYNYNAYYTVYLLDGVDRYREAVRTALRSLNRHYRDRNWEAGSADGFADAIESALNLYARESDVDGVPEWMDYSMNRMLAIQRSDGIVEGWHGDGNFARTAVMWALWKQQGVTLRPWREDVELGAVQRDGSLYVTVTAEKGWSGTVHFDSPRHDTAMNLPLDYPRINQFPEWYTVESDGEYRVTEKGEEEVYSGKTLVEGFPVDVEAEQAVEIRVEAME